MKRLLKKTVGIILTVCITLSLFICLCGLQAGAAESDKMFILNCDQNNVKIEYLTASSAQFIPNKTYTLKAKYVSDYGYSEDNLKAMFALWSCDASGSNTAFFRRMEGFAESYDYDTKTYTATFNATSTGSDVPIVAENTCYFKMRLADRNGDGTVKNCTVYLADISLICEDTGEDLLSACPIDEDHITTEQIVNNPGKWRIYPTSKVSVNNKGYTFGGEEPDCTLGDINGDVEIDNKDLTRLFQYLSGWEVEVNEEALDINGDGSVDNKDLTRFFQYLSGWDVGQLKNTFYKLFYEKSLKIIYIYIYI